MTKLPLCFLFLLVSLNSFLYVSSIYMRIQEGEKKCFIEEVPKDTLMIAKWSAVFNEVLPNDPVGIEIVVTDPESNPVLQQLQGLKGRAAFTSQIGGEYLICFQTNTSRWFGHGAPFRFDLELEAGVSATDYNEIAKKEHLSDLEVQIRRLVDRTKSIRAEQNYQKEREVEFRETSETTNDRVVFWSIIQTVALIVVGFWQINHLKNFFKAKKIV